MDASVPQICRQLRSILLNKLADLWHLIPKPRLICSVASAKAVLEDGNFMSSNLDIYLLQDIIAERHKLRRPDLPHLVWLEEQGDLGVHVDYSGEKDISNRAINVLVFGDEGGKGSFSRSIVRVADHIHQESLISKEPGHPSLALEFAAIATAIRSSSFAAYSKCTANFQEVSTPLSDFSYGPPLG